MRILIADDDPIVRILMRKLLRKDLGYEVVEAADGAAAWRSLNSGPKPDLCIFDVMMPVMGGLELLGKLRADDRFKQQKVMLCSTLSDRSVVLQAAGLGVKGYLLKPFVAADLLAQVRKVCDDQRPSAPRGPLEDLGTALKRLGSGVETYIELLNELTKQVRDFTESAVQTGAGPNSGDQKMQIIALRGAGLSLGATDLVSAVTKLQQALEANDAAAIHIGLEALKTENQRVITAALELSNPVPAEPDVVEMAPPESKPASDTLAPNVAAIATEAAPVETVEAAPVEAKPKGPLANGRPTLSSTRPGRLAPPWKLRQ